MKTQYYINMLLTAECSSVESNAIHTIIITEDQDAFLVSCSGTCTFVNAGECRLWKASKKVGARDESIPIDYSSRTNSKSYMLHAAALNARFYIYTYNDRLPVKDSALPTFTINLLPKPDSNHVLAGGPFNLEQ